jgi:hypothetical protein
MAFQKRGGITETHPPEGPFSSLVEPAHCGYAQTMNVSDEILDF